MDTLMRASWWSQGSRRQGLIEYEQTAIQLQPAPLLWTLTIARLARANPQITPAQLDTWLRPARLVLVTTDAEAEPPYAVLLARFSFAAHMLRLRYADAISRALADTLHRPVTLIVHHRPLPPYA